MFCWNYIPNTWQPLPNERVDFVQSSLGYPIKYKDGLSRALKTSKNGWSLVTFQGKSFQAPADTVCQCNSI